MPQLLPDISIITVSYNAEETIERTISSVLNQEYQGKLEYLVIDGGSTDKTVEIIRSYEQDLNWISEKDEGIYDAMNKGIQMANGEWIGILNSDDWYAKNALKKVGDYIQKNPAVDFLIGKMIRVDSFGKKGKIVAAPNYKEGILKPNNHPATFVKGTVYSELGPFDLRYKIAADLELIMRVNANPKVNIGTTNHLLTYMQEGGASNGFAGIIESYEIEKKYNGLVSALLVLTNRSLQKMRKRIFQNVLPERFNVLLQQKWWDKHRNGVNLSDQDYWFY